MIKKVLLGFLALIILAAIYIAYKVDARLNPTPTITESSTSIIGFNHIGISVLDLDKMLSFYEQGTGYKLIKRFSVSNNKDADALFGQDSIAYEKAILQGPNMLLEFTEFANQSDTVITKRSPAGPGMTHTCYQSSQSRSNYQTFTDAGISMLSRGTEPIDLGGYGVTYAYGYDPEGNMIELEQMADILISLKIGKNWAKENPIWMTQVAILSHDLDGLVKFYKDILEIEPYRVGSYGSNVGLDAIVDTDSVAFDAGWFGMDTQGKKLELMQYTNPEQTKKGSKRSITDLGYTFSFEVLDIQKEYDRLKNLGVEVVSAPINIDEFLTFFAYDVDGNLFSMRQAIGENSIYSLKNF